MIRAIGSFENLLPKSQVTYFTKLWLLANNNASFEEATQVRIGRLLNELQSPWQQIAFEFSEHATVAKVVSLWVPKAAGASHDSLRAQPCTFQTPPKFHERTPKREERKKIVAGERKKSAKFWAPHPSGPHPSGPTLRGPIFSRFGLPPFGAPPSVGLIRIGLSRARPLLPPPFCPTRAVHPSTPRVSDLGPSPYPCLHPALSHAFLT